MNFWRALVSAEDDVSSKRFSGLLLIGMYISVVIFAVIAGGTSEEVESMAKTGLYVGATLLGVSIAGEVIKTVVRPIQQAVRNEEEEEDESDK